MSIQTVGDIATFKTTADAIVEIQTPGLEKRVVINKNIYTRKPYGTNNYVVNSDFSTSLTTPWLEAYMLSSLGGSLASIESISGKSWLKLNCSTDSTTLNDRGYVYQEISVPPSLRYSVWEFSYDSFGFLQGTSLNNEQVFSYNIDIPQSRPERFYQYIRPNGATTILIKLFRCPHGQERAGQNVYFSNVQLTVAEYVNKDVSYNIPTVGLNIQLGRWLTDWKPEEHYQFLLKIKNDITPFVRVWLSSELFATYTEQIATKRDISNTYLTSSYQGLSKVQLPTGFDPDEILKVDWFFKTCDELGIKLHLVLGAGFGDNAGNPHESLSKRGTFEFLDTDTGFQTALTNYFVNIVNRYKSYKNIVGYEFINEGYYTWRAMYAGYITTASNATVRPGSYGGYRAWERATYTAIKQVDPTRPVILDLGLESSNSQYLAELDGVCDWFCPSVYLGKISLNVGNVDMTNNRFYPTKNYPNVLGKIKNGYKLIPYAKSGNTLPTGLTAGTTYYVINATSTYFELSDTSGGTTALDISGGSGDFFFYSPDGSLLDIESAVLDRLADSNKFVYFSEFGAPILDDKLLYRDANINGEYISAMLQRMGQYKIPAFIAFDEHNLFFGNQYVNKKSADRLIAGSFITEMPTVNPLSRFIEADGSFINTRFVGSSSNATPLSLARANAASNNNQFDFSISSGLGGADGALNILSINADSDIAFRGKTSGNAQWKMVGATGNFEMPLGGKLKIGTGTNASAGTATLVAGTVTVSTTAVATNSLIFVTYNTPAGTLAAGLAVPSGSISNGVSFVINSVNTAGAVNTADTSTVRWWIIN